MTKKMTQSLNHTGHYFDSCEQNNPLKRRGMEEANVYKTEDETKENQRK